MSEAPRKKKILALCDHPLSTSGVGIQARYLMDGLVATGQYSFRVFGAAIKHSDYRTVKVSDDLIIQPIDGFGNRDMLRVVLANEKPDALFLFTDPRFFIYIWEMEEEIHQICPIVYWHVWDNDPYPAFNKALYDSTDLINCLAHKTYELVEPRFPNRTHYIPHSLPTEMFYPLPAETVARLKPEILGPARADNFTVLWINRNARRKMPSDVMDSWRIFLDQLQAKHGHRNATLIMHTDPYDPEGPNLIHVMEMMGLKDNVVFSTERVEFDKINILHNISDCCINIATNEGFGLATLEAMYCGKPIIALKTGGLARQVVDYRDGSQNGIALDPDARDLVGSQMVPYIFEDHVNNNKVAGALLQMYEFGPTERAALGQKARDYALSEFSRTKMVSDWNKTLMNTIETWRSNYTPWELKVI